MIDNYKKYLVVGYLELGSISIDPRSAEIGRIGPFVEEVWALDAQDAARAWKNKVIRPGMYVKDSECEVRQI